MLGGFLMKKRHKIKGIKLSKNRPAFRVVTNDTIKWFCLDTKRVGYLLRYHLSHIYTELMKKTPQTKKDFEDILIGRYIYGRIKKIKRNEEKINILC